ncbi:hypothetical protein KVR01_009322 [Diaporthe batatas]|uniref:uncharacterized protein n=1 Tax=Diaporthe batatas TaxID=748121 RepID=UPI001D051FE2|nr:uncharacterized protein KVR01_009322 [Diaporthe batatas]KAG8161058.1 hypothetical protein KVR01_009322 [Diaporthe batatas]
MATSPKMSFRSVPKENKALATEIYSFVEKGQDGNQPLDDGSCSTERSNSQLEALLERLYVHICDFGRYQGSAATPDETILEAWESFLGVIDALATVEPHGYMMAARMTLYLTQAYSKHGQLPGVLPYSSKSAKPIALRCNFAIALDDLLLSCLTQLWSRSDKRELFTWVFTSYPVKFCARNHGITCQDFIGAGQSVKDFHEQRRKDHIRAASITDPARLTPENGVRPRRRWTRPRGDTTWYPRHPDASWIGYQSSAHGERMLMWQDIGSDGPIMGSYHYRLVDEDTRELHFRQRAALRRSRQFIMDARRIARYHLAIDSRRLAQMVMISNSLPAELQLMILEYLDDIQEPAYYLGKLDLAAVYRPFPKISKKCTSCSGRAHNISHRMANSTCPLNSITIWSLPLRAFHTFHQTRDGGWQVCPDIDCAGHHDTSWQMQHVSIEDQLNKIIHHRSGQSLANIGEIGLGPLEPAELPSAEEDRAREQLLFSGCPLDQDDGESREDRVEACWGGVAGLVGVMLHNETLLGLHATGRTSTEPSWFLGRTHQEEYKARVALARDHGRDRCAFC